MGIFEFLFGRKEKTSDEIVKDPSKSALYLVEAEAAIEADDFNRAESDLLSLEKSEVSIADFSNQGLFIAFSSDRKFYEDNSDIISGLEFCATMQLRTPLRVLLHHGEIHKGLSSLPPQYAYDSSEGIWVPKPKSFAERGIDRPQIPLGTMASDIGQVPEDGGDYLPCLIKIRSVVEANLTIDERIENLLQVEFTEAERKCIEMLGGMRVIIERLFPSFIYLGPDLDTPNKISAASDEELLKIKGIGPAKLKKIRAICAGITEERDSDRVDRVKR